MSQITVRSSTFVICPVFPLVAAPRRLKVIPLHAQGRVLPREPLGPAAAWHKKEV